jgi:hypothetical protein
LTTTQVPGVSQKAEPCWTVLKEDGDGTGYQGAENHYDTRELAEAEAKMYANMKVTVTQSPRGFRCWTATLLCGEQFIYEGDESEVHFADERHLLDCADVQGNMLIPGKGLVCDDLNDCEVCDPPRRAFKQELSVRDTRRSCPCATPTRTCSPSAKSRAGPRTSSTPPRSTGGGGAGTR